MFQRNAPYSEALPTSFDQGAAYEHERAALRERIRKYIQETSAKRVAAQASADGERHRAQLFIDLCRFQYRYVAPFRRYLDALSVHPDRATVPDDIPAVPTEVFRYARMAAHPAELDVRRFLSSGTTHNTMYHAGLTTQELAPRSLHAFRTMGLYDLAARSEAMHALFGNGRTRRLVFLAPLEGEAPDSSLSYMFSRFADWFGAIDARGKGGVVEAWQDGRLDINKLRVALERAERLNQPVALFGTSFAFVHAEDALGTDCYKLPEKSFVLHTGGFKGRSREIAPHDLRALLRGRYGLRDEDVRSEYGMTELSSQMYERIDTGSATGEAPAYEVPPWMRAVPVSLATGQPVQTGEVGVLRIEDISNLDSVCAIQTSDRARVTGRGLELLGRDPDALARGCSLAADAALLQSAS